MLTLPNITPETAGKLAQAGVAPEQAALRLWYGKHNPDRPTMAERVQVGLITAEQAADEIRRARAA